MGRHPEIGRTVSTNDGIDEIPRALRVLWGYEERPPRGPQQALSLERIVEAAIALADTEGLAALSMARLAERLGCGTMSLYRHVANKDELYVFMMDAAPGPPPDIGAGDWRAGLEQWARALQAVYYRHPWILQVSTGRPPIEPGQLGWLDRGLGALAGTGLTARQRISVAMLVLNYVRGEAQIMAVLMKGGPGPDFDTMEAQADYGRLLARFVQADRFPALAEIAAAGVFEPEPDAGLSADFDFGLARILDGIEALIAPS
jgi:AcrR family transcriptional regulator